MCKAIKDLMKDSQAKGIEQGIEQILTHQIKAKLEQNKTKEQIASEVELSVEKTKEYIQRILASAEV